MVEAQDAGEFGLLRVLTARRAYFDADLKQRIRWDRSTCSDNSKPDCLLPTGGISSVVSYNRDDSLHGQALSDQILHVNCFWDVIARRVTRNEIDRIGSRTYTSALTHSFSKY